MHETSASIHDALQELLHQGEPCVCVTVIETKGSVPQDPGAKLLVTAAGYYAGTVGGGRIEHEAIAQAQRMLQPDSDTARAQLVHWQLNHDLGMVCGGTITLFFEAYHRRPWPMVIFGAGHVAQALVRLLLTLDCQITCCDPRADWLERLPSSPKLQKKCIDDLRYEIPHIPDGAAVLIMTTGHCVDLPILVEILKTDRFPYVGVIGSKAKAARMRRGVAEAGLAAQAEQFYCPMGLPIGTNHPSEIAISIAAQLLQVRDGKLDEPCHCERTK